MTLSDNKTLRTGAARKMLLAGDEGKRAVLIHTAVTLGASVVTLLLEMVLNQRIESATGLAGLGSRGILETLRQLLLLANLIVLPFWELGIRKFALRAARDEDAGPGDLTEGFRRFGPVLRLMLIRLVLLMVLGTLCIYVGATIFSFTPAAAPIADAMMPYMEQMMADPYAAMPDIEALLAAIPEEAMADMTNTMLVICGVLMAILCLPVLYVFRLADPAVLDMPRTGAIMAMIKSFRAVRRHPLRMLKVDLGFWWYYLLLALTVAVSYGDTILKSFGASLPVSDAAAFLIAALLGAAANFALYLFARGRVEIAYAMAYDEMTGC